MTWAECKPFVSFIRAAAEAGLPPKQVIFNDPSHKEYDHWDLMLIKAHHFIQDFTIEGVPAWWDSSDRVAFEAKRKVSRSKAAIERAQEQDNGKNKPRVFGRYYIPEPRVIDGGEFPTFAEWVAEQREKDGFK